MKNIQVPEDAVVSASGVTWLDDSGIIIAIGKHHAIHTLEHAMENHRINIQLAGGIRRPFLIDMTDVKTMSHEARTFYAGPEPRKILTAVAILTNSSIGRTVANLYMTLAKPLLPTKLHTDHEEAKKWLLQYIDTSDGLPPTSPDLL